MSSIRYVLRHFDMARVRDPDKNLDNLRGEGRALFRTKQELLDHCTTENIELGLDWEWDTSHQNWAVDTWVVRGYDYVVLDIDQWFTAHPQELNGEGFDE
jgi:hypothetical protein